MQLEQPAPQARPDQRDLKALQVRKGPQDLLARRVHRERPAPQVPRVQQALRVFREQQVPWDCLGHLVRKVLQEPLDPKGPRVPPGLPARLLRQSSWLW